jgi:hypothetical protein
MVDSYANTKVRRSNLLKDPVVQQMQEPSCPQPDSPPSPLDAGLSASRIRLEKPGREVSA